MRLFIWICCSFKFMLTTMKIIVTNMGFFEIYIYCLIVVMLQVSRIVMYSRAVCKSLLKRWDFPLPFTKLQKKDRLMNQHLDQQ